MFPVQPEVAVDPIPNEPIRYRIKGQGVYFCERTRTGSYSHQPQGTRPIAMDGVDTPLEHQPALEATQKTVRRFTVTVVFPLLLMGCAFVIWSATQRTAANPAVEFSLRGKSFLESTPSSTLKIATFNIHSGKGIDGIRDLSRIAKTIPDDLDIVWLNEVRSGMYGLREDQTEYLASKTKRAFAFFPTENQYFHGHFGNALLTRRELNAIQYLPLPCSQQKRFRNAVLTTMLLDGVAVNVLATHLDENVDRLQQLRQIRSVFEGLKEPAILLGDLNSRTHESEMQAFFGNDPTVINVLEGKTGDRPDGHGVDWIIAKGLRVIDAGLIETESSDHPLLWAHLQLPKRLRLAYQEQ